MKGCNTLKLIVMRHGEVNYKWRKWSTSEQFNEDCRLYDIAPILPMSYSVPKEKISRCYVSTLSRSIETAHAIWGDLEYISSSLLDEVPLTASIETRKRLPLTFWNITGRLQWWLNSKNQKESRAETLLRAEQVLDLLAEKNENCVVITHGFFIHSLLKVMKERGFQISKKSLNYATGEYVVAERTP